MLRSAEQYIRHILTPSTGDQSTFDTPTVKNRGILRGLNSVHFCRKVFPELRVVSSTRPAAGHIAPQAGALLPGASGGKNVYCTDTISVSMKSARADVLSVLCVVSLPAYRARLARVCGIYIHDIDAGEFGFVLNELC